MTDYNPSTRVWKGRGLLNFQESDSVGKRILNTLEQCPDKVVQINDNDGVELTGREMRVRGIRVAENLKMEGFKQNDVIAIIARNTTNVAPVVLGCILIGAPVNTMDPKFGQEDVVHMMKITTPKAVFCDKQEFPLMKESLKLINLQSPIFVFEDYPPPGSRSVNELLAGTGTEDKFVVPILGRASETIAAILCSSGTTGLSKGVSISHAQFLVKLEIFCESADVNVLFTFSTLYWLSGFAFLMISLMTGNCRIITSETFNPFLFLTLVKKYKITNVFTPPSQIANIINCPDIESSDLSSIKVCICGGSMVSDHLKNSMQKYMTHGAVCVGYGMSECCGAISLNSANLPRTVGVLSAEMEVKITDVDDGSKLFGTNEDGELYIKIYPPFLGYYGNESVTSAVCVDGWFRTGDIGHFDDQGNLYIMDRKKEILKYCNYQISPNEIEEFIAEIDGVLMVAVVGIPDDIVTDLPAAVVIKKPNSELTAADISQKVALELADFKRLRGGVYFTDELPLTPSGKIIRRKVKDIALEFYNNIHS